MYRLRAIRKLTKKTAILFEKSKIYESEGTNFVPA